MTPQQEEVGRLLQMLLEKRGYIVIATYIPYSIGTVIDEPAAGPHDYLFPLKAVVIATTDRADYLEQHRVLEVPFEANEILPNYYRVIAE